MGRLTSALCLPVLVAALWGSTSSASAFVVYGAAGPGGELRRVEETGGPSRLLGTGEVGVPSPDGRLIAYVDPDRVLHLITSVGTPVSAWPELGALSGDAVFDVSADGRVLYRSEAGTPAVISIAEPHPQQIADVSIGVGSFSPDGRELAFDRGDSDDRTGGVFICNNAPPCQPRRIAPRHAGRGLWGSPGIAVMTLEREGSIVANAIRLVDPTRGGPGRRLLMGDRQLGGVSPIRWLGRDLAVIRQGLRGTVYVRVDSRTGAIKQRRTVSRRDILDGVQVSRDGRRLIYVTPGRRLISLALRTGRRHELATKVLAFAAA
jgi:hypothetical protein